MIVYLNETGARQCLDDPEKFVGLPLEAKNEKQGIYYDLYDLKGRFFTGTVSVRGFDQQPPGAEKVAEACKNYRDMMHYEAYPGNKWRK